MITRATCADCGEPLGENEEICPKCGSNRKIISVTIQESLRMEIHEKIKGKCKKKGMKRPAQEFMVGDDFHRKTGQWNYRRMYIDREKDWYKEIVIDKKTGKIIHCCKEPLSQHKGHGSAKKKS